MPLVITSTCIVGLITAPGFNDPAGPVIPEWYLPAVVSIFSLSLAANAVVTSLIVYKIMSVYRDLQTVGNCTSVRGSRGIYPVSILVESGLVTLAAQLVQTVLYKVDTNRFGIVSGIVVMLYVRTLCRMLTPHIFIYYAGNFINHRPCACCIGHLLQHRHNQDTQFQCHTLCRTRIE